MRLKNDDLKLLREIHSYLYEAGKRELSVPLAGLISRTEQHNNEERLAAKERGERNRKDGYKWKSSHHPKKSKYYKQKE